jgi:uncharacterized membrane protein (UPF0127 family)
VEYKASWNVLIRNRMGVGLGDAVIALFAVNGTGDIVGAASFEIPGSSAKPIAARSTAPPAIGHSVLDTDVGSDAALQLDSVERYICGVLRVIPESGAMWDDDSVRLRSVAATPLPFASSGETVTTRTISSQEMARMIAPLKQERHSPKPSPTPMLVGALPEATTTASTETLAAACGFGTEGDIAVVNLSHADVTLVIYDTEPMQTKGLTGRARLPEHCGALFSYSEDAMRTIWMKGVSIPLDLVFLTTNGTVKMVRSLDPPAPGTPDAAIPRATALAAKIIALPSGEAKRDGFVVGGVVSELP